MSWTDWIYGYKKDKSNSNENLQVILRPGTPQSQMSMSMMTFNNNFSQTDWQLHNWPIAFQTISIKCVFCVFKTQRLKGWKAFSLRIVITFFLIRFANSSYLCQFFYFYGMIRLFCKFGNFPGREKSTVSNKCLAEIGKWSISHTWFRNVYRSNIHLLPWLPRNQRQMIPNHIFTLCWP